MLCVGVVVLVRKVDDAIAAIQQRSVPVGCIGRYRIFTISSGVRIN